MAKNVVIIAGNIGAGKSTLVKYISQKSGFRCVQEFIDQSWRDLFYSERKRYTGPFEMSCLMGRKARYLTAKKDNNVVFFDRGLLEGREVFVQNSFDEGFLSFEELEDYDKNLKKALDDLGRAKGECPRWMESLIVYLKTDPKVCFERQKKRMMEKGDAGEVIPLEYFQRLNEYYEKFTRNMGNVYTKWGMPIRPKLLIINANQDITSNPDYLEETYKKIKEAINIKDDSIQMMLNIGPRDMEKIKQIIIRPIQLQRQAATAITPPGQNQFQQRKPMMLNLKQLPQKQNYLNLKAQQPQPQRPVQNPNQNFQPKVIKILRPWHVHQNPGQNQKPNPNPNFRPQMPQQNRPQQNQQQRPNPQNIQRPNTNQNQKPQQKQIQNNNNGNSLQMKPIDHIIQEIMQKRNDLRVIINQRQQQMQRHAQQNQQKPQQQVKQPQNQQQRPNPQNIQRPNPNQNQKPAQMKPNPTNQNSQNQRPQQNGKWIRK